MEVRTRVLSGSLKSGRRSASTSAFSRGRSRFARTRRGFRAFIRTPPRAEHPLAPFAPIDVGHVGDARHIEREPREQFDSECLDLPRGPQPHAAASRVAGWIDGEGLARRTTVSLPCSGETTATERKHLLLDRTLARQIGGRIPGVVTCLLFHPEESTRHGARAHVHPSHNIARPCTRVSRNLGVRVPLKQLLNGGPLPNSAMARRDAARIQ